MRETPKRKPRRKVAGLDPWSNPPEKGGSIPVNEKTLAELRAHWHRGRLDPDELRRAGEALYGPKWRTEIAKDLVDFRVEGKGGKRSGDAISHAIIGRWLRGGKDQIPAWVAPALLELPAVALARHRREAAAAEAAFARRLAEAQRAWIMDLVPRFMPAIVTLPLPEAATVPPGTEWPEATTDDLDYAEDMGSQAYQIAAGLSDDIATPRPADPALRVAWDGGWAQANVDHQAAHADMVARSGSGGGRSRLEP